MLISFIKMKQYRIYINFAVDAFSCLAMGSHANATNRDPQSYFGFNSHLQNSVQIQTFGGFLTPVCAKCWNGVSSSRYLNESLTHISG